MPGIALISYLVGVCQICHTFAMAFAACGPL